MTLDIHHGAVSFRAFPIQLAAILRHAQRMDRTMRNHIDARIPEILCKRDEVIASMLALFEELRAQERQRITENVRVDTAHLDRFDRKLGSLRQPICETE